MEWDRSTVEIFVPVGRATPKANGCNFAVLGPPAFDMTAPMEYLRAPPPGRWTMHWKLGDDPTVRFEQ